MSLVKIMSANSHVERAQKNNPTTLYTLTRMDAYASIDWIWLCFAVIEWFTLFTVPVTLMFGDRVDEAELQKK